MTKLTDDEIRVKLGTSKDAPDGMAAYYCAIYRAAYRAGMLAAAEAVDELMISRARHHLPFASDAECSLYIRAAAQED